jgi:cytochrome c-type biogenesis protein CcmH
VIRARRGSVAVGGALLAAFAIAWIAGASLALHPGTVLALTPDEVERRVAAIADRLRCPTCQAISVKDSEAAFSQQIREKVQLMVQEGQTDEQIEAFFVSRYGEWILRSPPASGVGLIVWILPGLAIAAAGGWITWSIVRQRTRGGPASAMRGPSRSGATTPSAAAVATIGSAAHASAVTPEQRERILADLKRYEEED